MKIGQLQTKIDAEEGAFLHLRHPALGHLLYTGDGADDENRLVSKDLAIKVGCNVLGFESETVREKAREIQRSKLKDPDDEQAAERGIEFVSALVTGFQGLYREDGSLLSNTQEDKRAFFMQSDDLVKQVMDFARDRGNFWKGGSAS